MRVSCKANRCSSLLQGAPVDQQGLVGSCSSSLLHCGRNCCFCVCVRGAVSAPRREHSEKAWVDMRHFKEQKDRDLREALVNFAVMQISMCKKVGRCWHSRTRQPPFVSPPFRLRVLCPRRESRCGATPKSAFSKCDVVLQCRGTWQSHQETMTEGDFLL